MSAPLTLGMAQFHPLRFSPSRAPRPLVQLATLRELFEGLRDEARHAESRDELAELHDRGGYLVSVARHLGARGPGEGFSNLLGRVAAQEFAASSRVLSRRAEELGLSQDFSARWTG